MGYKFETLKTKYGVKARITLGVSMLAPTSQCLRYCMGQHSPTSAQNNLKNNPPRRLNLTGDALRTTEQVLDPTVVDRCTREVDLKWSKFGLFPGFCQYFENNILKNCIKI